MNKETIEKIKELKKQKKYNDIFVKYGKKAYIKNTPSQYRKRELKKLKKEGKYLDIYNKYGEGEYNKLLLHARTQEIKETQGSLKAYSWNALQKMKMFMKKIGLYSAIGLTEIALGTSSIAQMSINENTVKYEKEIETYDDHISEYAEEIKAMHLNDLQTIMKVTDDMWKNIKGYATPEKDILGYLELDLATEDGYGVCRNMANDVAKKLNKIDERYNARILNVEIVEGEYHLADVERKVLETGEETSIPEEDNPIIKALQSMTGNHMITLVDIPEKDVTLVVDPTNPSLGVYANGKIKMFNSDKEYDTKETSTMLFFGSEQAQKVGESFIKSFISGTSYEELKQEYGLKKQNEALQYVRNLEKEQEEKEKTEKEKFKESLKVENKPQVNEKSQNNNTENVKEKGEDIQL